VTSISARPNSAVTALHLAAQLLHHRLLAVADAEHRHAHLEHRLWRARRVRKRDAGGSAGEDNGLGLRLQERGFGLVERHDFAIDAGLAHAPRDQLRHLAAEVDDENGNRHGRM